MRGFLRNSNLLTLMLGHLTVDSYAGLLPVLYPILIVRYDLNLATVGLLGLAYSGTAAVSQPLFGALADRFGTRWTGLTLGWTAFTFALLGFAPTFPMLLLVACASGLGSGAFHPFGALDVRSLLPPRNRSSGMSIYVTAGTVGVAIGPLVGVLILSAFGVRGLSLLIAPGALAGLYLVWRMRIGHPQAARARRPPGAGRTASTIFPLAVVIGVMMSRAWTVNVFQAFTPTWYQQLGFGPAFYGPLASVLVLSSAVGTVGCGSLADRYGRRTVIVGTLVLSIPAILIYTALPGPWAFGTAILIGFFAASTPPLMLLMAQQLMADRAGLASGLVMGLGFITGAAGIPITGAIADSIGLQMALMSNVILVLATIGLAWYLPSERRMEVLSSTRPPAPGSHLGTST